MASHLNNDGSSANAQRQPAQRRQAHMVVTTSDDVRPVAIEGLQTLHGSQTPSTSVLDGGRVSSRTARATTLAQERVGKNRRKKNSLVRSLLKGLLGIAVVVGFLGSYISVCKGLRLRR